MARAWLVGVGVGVAAWCVANASQTRAHADPFDPADLRATIAALASPDLDGRVPGTAGDRAARALIIDRLRAAGVAPGADGGRFEQPFAIDRTPTANIIGVIAGTTPGSTDLVMIGAHYDHLGGGKLGANDNASGVAAVLAIADDLHRHPPKRTVVVALWSGEEPGLLGSEHFVAHPTAAVPLASVVEYINLDMIGSYAARHAVYAFGAAKPLAAHAVLAAIARRHPHLDVRIGGHSERGDNLGFCEHAIPYVFLWTPDPRCYHEACDTVDRLDLPHTAEIAQLAGELVHGLADSDRDLAADRASLGCGEPTR